jgi:hypothetical protein
MRNLINEIYRETIHLEATDKGIDSDFFEEAIELGLRGKEAMRYEDILMDKYINKQMEGK